MAYRVEVVDPGDEVGVSNVEAFQVKEGTVFWQRNSLTVDVSTAMWSCKNNTDTGLGGVDVGFLNNSKSVIRVIVETT